LQLDLLYLLTVSCKYSYFLGSLAVLWQRRFLGGGKIYMSQVGQITTDSAVEEHGADQVEDRNIDPRELELEATVTEKESMADVQLSAWEWGQDPMELEISSETVHALTELTSSAIIPTSASATEDTNSSTDDSPALHSD
jgi:hypothetical protein